MLTRALVLAALANATPALGDNAERDAANGEAVVSTVALTPARASALPPQGIYLSGRTRHSTNQVNEDFYIARLDAKGLRVLHREHPDFIQRRAALGQAWLDDRTLITNDYRGNATDSAALTIFRMTGDAAPQVERIVVKAEDWRLGRLEVPDWQSELLLTARGEIWLAQCLRKSKRTFACVHERFLRVVGGPRTIKARPPAGVIDPRRLMPLPRLARAPAGYRVKLHAAPRGSRQGGFTCTGPTGTHVSPDDDTMRDPSFPVRPERIRWVMAKPPIYEVSGKMDTPVAEVMASHEVYRACEPSQLLGFGVIRPRLWMETSWEHAPQPPDLSHTIAKLYIDEQAIGTVAGDTPDIAFSP